MDTTLQEWTVTEFWPYAVVMIVIGSWALYHFMAPASWREWVGAGLIQAFIIALYGEMYGFPLTIYALTTFLPIKIPLVHSSGHLWATLLGYGESGDAIEMLAGSVFVVIGLVMIVRGWVRIYFANDALTTDGIYRLVRHPQYTGIFLAVFGQLIHWPTIPTLLLSPVIIWLYVRLAKREERRLLEKFGPAYREYQQRVPMFFPRWQDFRQMLSPS
ncbi:Isoprenylcysteine carboxyl methyltransferase [Mesorhizobium metallidurans STM 2683]|uniref:Isoprenylcysteine carboxyl methyltransferase n=1 Tax=Mesorhizobium metallidurans STM 2683 TaxID=1297569 RepID=M5EZR0_9HYPH|nr:isoprenylcysteine carboxylmethyltransferase family protein [Mesorhizobium metallidurans]CCV09395.1 Isoprenylcysteine carboxyl methyltransferase [Mesorhizobium metallidurans STM 2683]